MPISPVPNRLKIQRSLLGRWGTCDVRTFPHASKHNDCGVKFSAPAGEIPQVARPAGIESCKMRGFCAVASLPHWRSSCPWRSRAVTCFAQLYSRSC